MNCTRCGNVLRDGAIFCTACGSAAQGSNMTGNGSIFKFYESEVVMTAIVKKDVSYFQEMFRRIANNDFENAKIHAIKDIRGIKKFIKAHKMQNNFLGLIWSQRLFSVCILVAYIIFRYGDVDGYIIGLAVMIAAALGVIYLIFKNDFKNNFNKIYYHKVNNFIAINSVTEENVNTVFMQEKINKMF